MIERGKKSVRWMGSRLAWMGVMAIASACGTLTVTTAPTPVKVAVVPSPAPTATPTPKSSRPAPAKKARTSTVNSSPAASTPAAPAAKAAPVVSPAQQLAAAVQAMAAIGTYKSQVTTTDHRKDKGKTNIATSEIYYRNGQEFRINVLRSTGLATGARFVYRFGESQATVRMGGILGLAAVSMSTADKNLCTQNGWRLDQVLLKGVVNRLDSDGLTVEVAGTAKLGETPVTVYKLTGGANPLDADVTYEQVAFDSQNVLRLWSVYAKPELGLPDNLMYQATVNQLEKVSSLPDSLFSL